MFDGAFRGPAGDAEVVIEGHFFRGPRDSFFALFSGTAGRPRIRRSHRRQEPQAGVRDHDQGGRTPAAGAPIADAVPGPGKIMPKIMAKILFPPVAGMTGRAARRPRRMLMRA